MDNPFGQRIPKLRVSLLGPRASHDSLNSVAVLPYLGRRLGRRYREARALSHASAIATCRCPTTLGSQAGLKPNAPAFAIRALGGGLARVGPKLRARAARRGPRTSRPEMALSVPSRIPLHLAPFGARECKNVVIGVRSQVGLIRHADQEISVRPSADRSSPYWVRPRGGGHETKPRNQACRSDDACPIIEGKAGAPIYLAAGDDMPAIGKLCPTRGITRLAGVLPGEADLMLT